MNDSLQKAKELAESVRFAGDTLRSYSSGNQSHTNSVRALFYQSGLQISREITPILSKRLDRVYKRLYIPEDAVEAFVYASPDIHAECYTGSTSECVIRFSSALVDILDADEFDFVAGHELGHFLLGHSVARMEANQQSLEFYIQQRCQEISVDRIGLIACDSLDIAIKALMKTISGLTSQYLRLDVGTFISQLKKSSLRGSEVASHPSIFVRCRALLWFSLDDSFVKSAETFSPGQITKLDEQIQIDFSKYVDGHANERIQEAKDDLAIWMTANEIVQNSIFEKREQIVFAEMFGEENLEKLKNFLSDIPISEVQNTVFEKMVATREDLETLIPSNFNSVFSEIKLWIESNIRNSS